MGVNSLPKTVIRQRRGCDLNTGPSAPASRMLTTRRKVKLHLLCPPFSGGILEQRDPSVCPMAQLPRRQAHCLFRAHGQPTATGVLLSVDQSRGTVYLWHCDQVTSRRRHLKTFLFNCLDNQLLLLYYLNVHKVQYSIVDSYRDIDSYVTILPSMPTQRICGPCELALYKCP